MKKPTTISNDTVSEYRELVQLQLRKRVLEAIELVIEEEVEQALGCRAYERSGERRGYRNGVETRRVTTAVGTREIRVPRARLQDAETGEMKEFRSELLPRYARRTQEVDEAILATYLSGANSRRIRKALKPLLGEEHLSKSAVSRVVSRLKERFEEWQNRDLGDEAYTIVYLDGFHLKVRLAKRVVSVPVLAALGVAPDGHKRLLSLRLAVSEASTHWGSLVEDLRKRGLPAPELVISDGHKGLTKALKKWPESRLQHCVVHKSANLLEHCPAHARRELKRDLMHRKVLASSHQHLIAEAPRHRAPRAASLATGTARLASSKDSRSQTCLISSPPRLIASLSSSPSLPLWLLAPLPSPPLWPWLPAPLATPGPPADGIETPRRAL